MSLAMQWVARITAVSLVMFFPGIAGQWLDRKLGTSFLTVMGFGLGFAIGFAALLVMVRAPVAIKQSDMLTSETDQQIDGDGGER